MTPKRLYKSRRNRKLFGVCGGIAEYFNIDPVLVRLGWIAAGLMFGSGILAYVLAALIIPDDPPAEWEVD